MTEHSEHREQTDTAELDAHLRYALEIESML